MFASLHSIADIEIHGQAFVELYEPVSSLAPAHSAPSRRDVFDSQAASDFLKRSTFVCLFVSFFYDDIPHYFKDGRIMSAGSQYRPRTTLLLVVGVNKY